MSLFDSVECFVSLESDGRGSWFHFYHRESLCVLKIRPKTFLVLLSGSRLRFHSGVNVEWQDVEDLESAERQRTDEELSDFLKVVQKPSEPRLQRARHLLIAFHGPCRVTARRACS